MLCRQATSIMKLLSFESFLHKANVYKRQTRGKSVITFIISSIETFFFNAERKPLSRNMKLVFVFLALCLLGFASSEMSSEGFQGDRDVFKSGGSFRSGGSFKYSGTTKSSGKNGNRPHSVFKTSKRQKNIQMFRSFGFKK